MGHKKVSDEILLESYLRLKNIWLVAKEVGLCGQSVWERIIKLGAINKDSRNRRTREFADYDILKEKYVIHRNLGTLHVLAKELNRTVPFICRKAKTLGLTTYNYVRTKEHTAKISKGRSITFKIQGHPKGMLGKKHSKESCSKMSKTRLALWESYSDEEKVAIIRVKLDGKLKKYGTLSPQNNRGVTWKQGWRTINGIKYYFRSRWEYNYALVLQLFKLNGLIKDWKHEPKTFTFEKELTKLSYYLPDFEVTLFNGIIEYHEVKGWMDDRSILKLNLMAKWYPKIKIIIIDVKWFKANKEYSKYIKEWEPMKV